MILKRISALLLAILMCLGIFGCSKSGDEKKSSGVASRKNSSEAVVAIGDEPETGFDSTTGGHGSITKVFFSTLFARDKELGWQGDLATDYSVSDDKLIWTVKLRDDAYFTDGEKVKAEDVVFTYDTAKNSGGDIDLTMIDKIEATDDNTVVFTLNRTYSAFIERLAYLGIVPKHAYNDTFKDAPIGSGPFKFVQWDKGQQVIAVRNDDYYGEKAKLAKLTMVFLDTDTAYAAVKNGEVDAALINGTLASKSVPGTEVVDLESIECYGVCFPMIAASDGQKTAEGYTIGNDITADKAIRKALNVATDRQKIVDGVFNGYASVSTTGLEKMPWLNEETALKPSEYGNCEAAKKILADAGWVDTDKDGVVEKDGLKAELTLLYTEGSYRQELGLEFVNIANSIGIKIELELRTWDTILPDIHSNPVLYGFGSGDPSELYNLYYGSSKSPVAWDNSGKYKNEKVDECVDKAFDSTDEKEAMQYWTELQTYAGPKGDITYCWFANAHHVYLVQEGFSFGNPVVQPHGGRIFDNVVEWNWG